MKTRRIGYVLLLLIGFSLFALTAHAQTVLWQVSYGFVGSDQVGGVVVASDDRVAVAIKTQQFNAREDLGLLLLSSLDGAAQRLTVVERANWQVATDIVQLSDGGFAILGYTTGENCDYTMLLARFDEAGALMWVQEYANPSFDLQGYALVETADGLLLAGLALDGTDVCMDRFWDPADLVMILVDSAGNEMWQQTLDGSGGDWANEIVATTDGGFLLVGVTSANGWGNSDTAILKLDAAFQIEWYLRNHGENGETYATDATQTTDGGYVIIGTRDTNDEKSAVTVKVGQSGNVEWVRVLRQQGVTGDYWGSAITALEAGGVVAGVIAPSGTWIVELSAAGMIESDYLFESIKYGIALDTTSNGDIIVGAFEPVVGQEYDIWLARMSRD